MAKHENASDPGTAADYPDNISGMHGTPYNSQSKSRQGESPIHIQSSSAQRRAELERQQMPPPTPRQPAPAASAAQAIVDNSRARRAANSAARPGGAGLAPKAAPADISSPIPRARPVQANMDRPRCLSDKIRSEPYLERFKEPSKIANYDPHMDLKTWLSSYEMAMCIRNASENLCAKLIYLMMTDGAAKLWFNSLPEKSVKSWSELKAAFIKNFQGTC